MDLTPDGIRRLRGKRSRAAFAREIGVASHTVYRWELAPTSPHARRPSGAVIDRLRQIAEGRGEAVAAAPPAPIAAPGGDLDAETVRALAAVERILDGDWRAGEKTALALLAGDGGAVPARALAGAGLALVELLFRADARRAIAALAPARAGAAALPPAAAAYVEVAIALAHALPDGQLFDIARVLAHTARAEALARPGDGAIAGLACLAQVSTALLAGDEELLLRALARVEDAVPGAAPPLIELHLEQMRSLEATLRGQPGATERLERLLGDPRVAACPPLEARTCALLALRRLDDLGAPEACLELARRSHAIAHGARLAVGVHTAMALRAESEALLRLGQLDAAGAVFAGADRILAEQGVPMPVVLVGQARYLLWTERADELDALAARLAACEVPSLRAACDAHAAYLAALASLVRVDDAAIALPRFARAEELAGSWTFLRREVLLFRVGACLVHGAADEARSTLRRAQRLADRLPSAWVSAHLRRLEGLLLAITGRWREGRNLSEAAAAIFELAGDRLDAAVAAYAAVAIERRAGEPGADEREARAVAALAEVGLAVPAFFGAGVARAGRSADAAPAGDAGGAEPLLVALERLAAPGTAPPLLLRELIQVVADLVPARPARIEELDSDGGVHAVTGDGAAPADRLDWFEFGDGVGRRLRLGLARPLSDADRAAVRVVLLGAGLALEVASLRGLGAARPAGAADDGPDLPGVIAVSTAMRRLRADVGRLAGSRATVVITGESGTGKEVIARAVHDRSPRAGKPYVAFNCAAVPHDLFEGQLFGFRRGAFTGATADQPGVIRAADGGTLFLDEIGELPLDVQPKLLRFLENGEVFPIGAQRPVTVDVRVVAATHRDLADWVRQGRFREDLYYRLQVVPLRIPPLRERRDDIPALARHFLRQLAPERTPVLAPDAVAALIAHDWPGNVRELRNAIERALAYAPQPDVLSRALLGL